MAMRPEARVAARFRLVGVDGERVVVAATRMRDVIRAASQRTRRPRVDEIEYERRLDADRRMQCGRWAPRAKAHTGDVLARNAGRCERQRATIACDAVALARHSGDLYLQPLDRR